jgi:hypothetical protein
VMELIEHKQINAPNFMTGLSNIHHPKSWNPFGHMMSKAFPYVIPFHKVNAQNRKSLLQYLWHHAVRESVQNCLQLQPSCIKMLQPTTQTLSRVFYNGRVCEVLQLPLYSPDLSPCDNDLPNWSHHS